MTPRPQFQFTVRTLLIAVTLSSALLGWLAMQLHRGRSAKR